VIERILDRLLNAGYEVSTRKVGDVYQVRLVRFDRPMIMAEGADLGLAMIYASDEAGFIE